MITGSSSDQLNKGRTYTFTPFARASQFAKAQLQMAKLVSDKPKVAVIFENTAFGTSTSNGLKELAPGEGVEIVMFEPYSAGFTDASPLINKVKASGANALFSVSYLNDLILIVRTVKQVGLNIAINGGSGGFVIPDFYKNVGKLAEGLQGVAHWNHDMDDDAQKVNVEYKKRTGEFLFEYAGGLVAQTFMLADALERAGSADPQKVREALSTLDVSSGYAAMAPGGKVKFGPDGKNIYGRPVGVQWQNGDLASVFPKEDARAPADENLTRGQPDVGDSGPGRHQRPAHRRHLRARQHRRHADLRRGQDRQFRPGRIRDDRDVHLASFSPTSSASIRSYRCSSRCRCCS